MLLSNFLKNPKQVGSIAPSSRFLAREMLKSANLENAKNIIELGPGSGAFTKGILSKMNDNSRLLCFEVNKEFCSHLRKTIKDSRISLVNSRAEDMKKEMEKIGMKKADCIISGLPFRNFSKEKRNEILNEVKSSLSKDGKFVLFQYTNAMDDDLRSNFGNVEKKFILLNVPPAFVYRCVN